MKPKAFIGSSSESIYLAHAIQKNIRRDSEATAWDQGIFGLSQYNLEALISEMNESDFGIFVFSPDDLVKIRGKESPSVRDNVLFEFGLCIGILGRARTFFVVPEDEKDFRLPTDLLGITPAFYESGRTDQRWDAALGPACADIVKIIKKSSYRIRQLQTSGENEIVEQPKIEEKSQSPVSISNEAKSEVSNTQGWIANILNKNYEKAKDLLQKEIDSESDRDIVIDKKAWLVLVDSKIDPKTEEARSIKFKEDYPDHYLPYESLSLFYSRSQNEKECLKIIDEGLLNIPGKEELVLLKAKSLREFGRIEEAKSYLNTATSEFPKMEKLFVEMGEMLIEDDNKEEVKRYFESTIPQFPISESLLSMYGSYLHENNDDSEEDLIIYRDLSKRHEDNPRYHTMLGNVYLRNKYFNEALSCYRKANLSANEKQAWIVSNIGNLYNNVGLYSEGAEWLRKGLEIDPQSSFALERLSQAIKNDEKEKKEIENSVKEKKRMYLKIKE